VRLRAGCACEYCGVSETDSGGPLTVDHHHPQSQDGSDDLDNLLYCCWRCNLYKAACWPAAGEPHLWNPRQNSRDKHLLLLADGTLHPTTPTGEFTIRRLRLNRPALVAHRLRESSRAAEATLLRQYREALSLLETMQRRHADLLAEHRGLLEQQRELLRLLLREGR
jgi:hypothetical protein